jgi:hypothetical protein
MKKLQQLCATAVLTLSVVTFTYAGDIYIGKTPPPPPEPPSNTAAGEIGVPGIIDCPRMASSSMAQVTMGLLQALLLAF